jgi:hypothetical protein
LIGGLTTAIRDPKFQMKEVSGDRATVLGEFEGTAVRRSFWRSAQRQELQGDDPERPDDQDAAELVRRAASLKPARSQGVSQGRRTRMPCHRPVATG